MSTFLVSLGVVAVTIAAVLHVVLNGPEQPATIQRESFRARPRRSRRAARARDIGMPEAATSLAGAPVAAVAVSPNPGLALQDSDVMRLRVLPATATTLWVRVRSGVVLVVLVAVLGALVALAVGGGVLGAGLLIRSATA